MSTYRAKNVYGGTLNVNANTGWILSIRDSIVCHGPMSFPCVSTYNGITYTICKEPDINIIADQVNRLTFPSPEAV